MADNLSVTPGTGGSVASDDIAGVHYQRVKISVGADGSATDATTTNPLPVDALPLNPLATGYLPVRLTDGTAFYSASGGGGGGEVTNAGTFAVQVTSLSDGGNSITVDGTVAISGTVAVTDNGGSLTVDGTVAATQSGTWNIGSITTLPALPAGSNAIGTVTSVGGAAENAAVSGNPVLVGGRYDSSARTLGSGDVGAVALNASGQMLVEIAAGAGSGGTAMADGATFTRNTTSLTPAGAVVETSAPTLTNGDVAGLSQTTGGALRVSVAEGGVSGKLEDAAHTTGDEGLPVWAVRRDTAAVGSGTDGDYSSINVNASGRLYTTTTIDAAIPAGTNNIGDVDVLSLPALPTGSNTIGAVNIAAAQTLATVTTVATVTNITNQGHGADDAAFTVGTTRVMMGGFLADETATDSVDEGDMGAARITLDRKQVQAQYAHTAGGWTPVSTVSAASTNATSLKGSAGQVGAISVTNVNAAMRYLKLYNLAVAPTVGTSTPVFVIPIPGNTAGAGAVINFGAGLEFTTGIAWALTSGAAVADTGAVSASEHIVSIAYK